MTSSPLLGEAELAILRAVATYYYLTAEQLRRLLYQNKRPRYAQEQCARLTRQGYLTRTFLPKPTPVGKAPFVYQLSILGTQALREVGVHAQVQEQKQHTYLFLAHTLLVNDFLIAAHRLARSTPTVHIRRTLHERALKEQPAYVLEDGKRVAVVPDAWLDIAAQGYQVPIALELDRATEEQSAWRRKVRRLLAWYAGSYPEQCGTDALTIAVVTTAGPAHRDTLRTWTAREVERLHYNPAAGTLFSFTCQLPPIDNEYEYFYGHHWYTPLGENPLPLLGGE